MNKKLINAVYTSLVTTLLLLSSCEANNEVIPKEEEGEKVEVEIVFGVEQYETPVLDTRSGSAPDEQSGIVVTYHNDPVQTKADDPDDKIESICIFQFENNYDEATDKLIAKIKLPVTALTKKTDSKGQTVYSTTVELVKKEKCHLFIAANEPEASFFNAFTIGTSTVQNYKEREQVFATPESNTIFNNLKQGKIAIPMSGYYSGTLPVPDVTVWLTRVFAKITLLVSFAPDIDGVKFPKKYISPSLEIGNMTDRYRYFDRYRHYSSSWDTYPAIPFGKSTYKVNETPENNPITIWIPENRRGTNSKILNQKNKWSETDPSWSDYDGRGHSTYIRFSGGYGEGKYNIYIFEVTLFPGENITTDFNIRGNTHYVITASIKNIAADDKRIRISGSGV